MGLRQVHSDGLVDIVSGRIGPTLVAFMDYASIPCDHFRPELVEVAKELDSRIEVIWINADENPTITEEMLIKAVPTTILFRKGDEVARFEGPYSRESMIAKIAALI